jgi:hypothetical protein
LLAIVLLEPGKFVIQADAPPPERAALGAGARAGCGYPVDWRERAPMPRTILAHDQLIQPLRNICGDDLPSTVFDATGQSVIDDGFAQLAKQGDRLAFIGWFIEIWCLMIQISAAPQANVLTSRNFTSPHFTVSSRQIGQPADDTVARLGHASCSGMRTYKEPRLGTAVALAGM